MLGAVVVFGKTDDDTVLVRLWVAFEVVSE